MLGLYEHYGYDCKELLTAVFLMHRVWNWLTKWVFKSPQAKK